MDAQMWLLLAPLILVQLGLLFFSLRDLLLRRPRGALVWGLVICLISLIGPLLYWLFGRRETDGPRDSDA